MLLGTAESMNIIEKFKYGLRQVGPTVQKCVIGALALTSYAEGIVKDAEKSTFYDPLGPGSELEDPTNPSGGAGTSEVPVLAKPLYGKMLEPEPPFDEVAERYYDGDEAVEEMRPKYRKSGKEAAEQRAINDKLNKALRGAHEDKYGQSTCKSKIKKAIPDPDPCEIHSRNKLACEKGHPVCEFKGFNTGEFYGFCNTVAFNLRDILEADNIIEKEDSLLLTVPLYRGRTRPRQDDETGQYHTVLAAKRKAATRGDDDQYYVFQYEDRIYQFGPWSESNIQGYPTARPLDVDARPGEDKLEDGFIQRYARWNADNEELAGAELDAYLQKVEAGILKTVNYIPSCCEHRGCTMMYNCFCCDNASSVRAGVSDRLFKLAELGYLPLDRLTLDKVPDWRGDIQMGWFKRCLYLSIPATCCICIGAYIGISKMCNKYCPSSKQDKDGDVLCPECQPRDLESQTNPEDPPDKRRARDCKFCGGQGRVPLAQRRAWMARHPTDYNRSPRAGSPGGASASDLDESEQKEADRQDEPDEHSSSERLSTPTSQQQAEYDWPVNQLNEVRRLAAQLSSPGPTMLLAIVGLLNCGLLLALCAFLVSLWWKRVSRSSTLCCRYLGTKCSYE